MSEPKWTHHIGVKAEIVFMVDSDVESPTEAQLRQMAEAELNDFGYALESFDGARVSVSWRDITNNPDDPKLTDSISLYGSEPVEPDGRL